MISGLLNHSLKCPYCGLIGKVWDIGQFLLYLNFWYLLNKPDRSKPSKRGPVIKGKFVAKPWNYTPGYPLLSKISMTNVLHFSNDFWILNCKWEDFWQDQYSYFLEFLAKHGNSHEKETLTYEAKPKIPVFHLQNVLY